VTFDVEYRGVPRTGLIIGKNRHGERTFFSDDWPDKARNWLPMVDHPSDKATGEFAVVAPAHYQVVSNGRLVEETDLPGDRRLTRWRQSVPIASWLYAIGVAHFAVDRRPDWHGIPIETWVYAQDRDAGFYDFAVPTRDVLDFFDEAIGPYSYEKLANVQSNSVKGGMEAATSIFYDDKSVAGDRSIKWRNVVIHEIAHQWFGNAVTESDWNDVWLSEGFATYFTLLFMEHAYGRDEFVRGLEASRRDVLSYYKDDPEYCVVHADLRDMSRVTSWATYQKGAWTLHQLRHEVGDEAFWAGIRLYYRRFRDRNASTADFRSAMEEASGKRLEPFFTQWLYRGGVPKLRGGWRYDAGQRVVTVALEQLDVPGGPFTMPLEVGIVDSLGGAERVERIPLGGVEREWSFRVEREPVRVVLDPGTWALFEAEFGRLAVR
jgi:aminopeptidase N